MTKYTKMLSRVVTISTYAIIFCVIGNMVMPALIVDAAQSQAVSSSTTAQAQADAAKKALDKAQADAKAVTYKELGLTKAEITFSDSFDMNTINQKVDKYVTYDKNGVASLNANAYRKDGTVKLSKSNTELVISIANKMIAKYNKDLKDTGLVKDTSKKTVNTKGFSVETTVNLKEVSSQMVSAAAIYSDPRYCTPLSWVDATNYYWWGKTARILIDKCMANDFLLVIQGRLGMQALLGGSACAGMLIFGGVPGAVCGVYLGFLLYFMQMYSGSLSYLITACNNKLEYWEVAPYWSPAYMSPGSLTCH